MTRSLDPTTHCDACEAEFHQRGSIGICDHDWPGRPLRRFWSSVGPVTEDPAPIDAFAPDFFSDKTARTIIAVCWAATWAEARETLETPQQRQVSELTTWWLFPALEGRDRGQRAELAVARTPSVYDAFKRGDGTTDYRELEDAGFDVS